MRPSFPLLKPPLEVSETFGGAKVSDDDQLKTKLETPKYNNCQDCHLLCIKHHIEAFSGFLYKNP